MFNDKEKGRQPSHRFSGLKSNNTCNDNKFLANQQGGQLQALIQEYVALNDRITTEHSSVLTNSQLSEEQKLREELFNLLRQRGVRI